jgi:hypothetical protein
VLKQRHPQFHTCRSTGATAGSRSFESNLLGFSMKATLPLLICASMLAGPLSAEDSRTFTNRDGSKTFQAELTGYNSFNKMVTVRQANGRLLRFNISLLSEKDREYVEINGPKLTAKAGLRISCDMDRGASKKSMSGSWEHKEIPCHYTIAINNSRNELIEDAAVDYTIFVERNPKKGGSSVETIQGSSTIGMILRNYTEHVTTSTVVLHEWRDNPPLPVGGGGC